MWYNVCARIILAIGSWADQRCFTYLLYQLVHWGPAWCVRWVTRSKYRQMIKGLGPADNPDFAFMYFSLLISSEVVWWIIQHKIMENVMIATHFHSMSVRIAWAHCFKPCCSYAPVLPLNDFSLVVYCSVPTEKVTTLWSHWGKTVSDSQYA